jgi:hypothetical protein
MFLAAETAHEYVFDFQIFLDSVVAALAGVRGSGPRLTFTVGDELTLCIAKNGRPSVLLRTALSEPIMRRKRAPLRHTGLSRNATRRNRQEIQVRRLGQLDHRPTRMPCSLFGEPSHRLRSALLPTSRLQRSPALSRLRASAGHARVSIACQQLHHPCNHWSASDGVDMSELESS